MLQQSKTTLILKDFLGNVTVATSMEDKAILVRKTAFPPSPQENMREPRIPPGTTYKSVIKAQVYNASIAQLAKKAPGLDKINFEVLQRFWNWKSERMTQILKQAIWLGYHLQE